MQKFSSSSLGILHFNFFFAPGNDQPQHVIRNVVQGQGQAVVVPGKFKEQFVSCLAGYARGVSEKIPDRRLTGTRIFVHSPAHRRCAEYWCSSAA